MLDKLTKLIEGSDARQFARLLLNQIEVKTYVDDHTKLWSTENASETIYCLVNDVVTTKCPCGKKALFNSYTKGYRKFCSAKCPNKGSAHSKKMVEVWSDQDRLDSMVATWQNTIQDRYGVTNVMDDPQIRARVFATNNERYGADMPFQSEAVRDRAKATLLERIGVETPFESAEIRARAEASFIENHGVPNKMQIARAAFNEQHGVTNAYQAQFVKDGIKATMVERYGVEHALQNADILSKMQEKYYSVHGVRNPFQLHLNRELYEIIQNKEQFTDLITGSSVVEITEKYECSIDLIYDYHDRYGLDILKKRIRSRYEEEIADILSEIGVNFERNNQRLIRPLELDFYLPDHNLAIEFNGLYWHSEINGNKNKSYHAEKTNQCLEHGVQLLTIFEDEWLNRKDIIVRHISHLCGKSNRRVGARKTTIVESDNSKEVREFLEANHIQGSTFSFSKAWWAIHEDERVAVFVVRQHDDGSEITRYCTKGDASFPGLFTKFISHVKKTTEITKLMTIADLRWSCGDVYLKSGFELVDFIEPDYFYTDCKKSREHKFNFRKDRIASKYGLVTEGKTERELTTELGLDRIWDCGKLKFELVLSR
jgi:very-short-patch-repair endonuclease/endogenous inhibitor of DNA gyrase (YacG/DUF329 family)